jgi:hypothetical protein
LRNERVLGRLGFAERDSVAAHSRTSGAWLRESKLSSRVAACVVKTERLLLPE